MNSSKKVIRYGMVYQYRKTRTSELVSDRFFFDSCIDDIVNACEMELKKLIKERKLFSGQLLKVIE